MVTKSLIENRNINHVTLNVKLKITDHDGRPIKSDGRINIYKDDDNMCVLEIKEACESDTGDYSFKCTSTDGFPIEVKGSVLVMNQSAPFNVKAEATEKEINVSWDAAIGNVKSYNVEYLHEPDMVIPGSLVVSKRTKAALPNLLPGETYKVYVRSVSEEGVSEPEPPEGLTVHTPPETPVGYFMKDSIFTGLSRVIWENPNKNSVFLVITVSNLNESVNADNTYVVPSELNRFYINLMQEHTYDSEERRFRTAKYSCSLYSFYKGIQSKNTIIDKDIECLYLGKQFFIRQSTPEYYDAVKELSYPLNMDTLKRGRALVFVTEGQSMDFQMDLLKLFASLSIQHWIIHDPDIETIDWYLKDVVQKKEHDNVDYCLVFFIGRHFGNGIDTGFITKKGYFKIFEKCHSVFSESEKECQVKIPIFVIASTKLSSEPKPLSGDLHVFSNTGYENFDYHFMFANATCEYDKWNFLKVWVDCLIEKCDHMPLEDIAKHVVENITSCSDETNTRPQIVSLLSKKLNLFPGLTKNKLDQRFILEKLAQKGQNTYAASDAKPHSWYHFKKDTESLTSQLSEITGTLPAAAAIAAQQSTTYWRRDSTGTRYYQTEDITDENKQTIKMRDFQPYEITSKQQLFSTGSDSQVHYKRHKQLKTSTQYSTCEKLVPHLMVTCDNPYFEIKKEKQHFPS